MSNAQRILLIGAVILVMTTLAFFTLESPQPESATYSSYVFTYLIGFITPLISFGAILLIGCSLVLRSKKPIRILQA
jgi:hypothetical protein